MLGALLTAARLPLVSSLIVLSVDSSGTSVSEGSTTGSTAALSVPVACVDSDASEFPRSDSPPTAPVLSSNAGEHVSRTAFAVEPAVLERFSARLGKWKILVQVSLPTNAINRSDRLGVCL